MSDEEIAPCPNAGPSFANFANSRSARDLTIRLSSRSYSRHRGATARRPVAYGPMIESLLDHHHMGLIPPPMAKLSRIHSGMLHFQFRTSGRSSPFLAMYCLCSMSLSFKRCFR